VLRALQHYRQQLDGLEALVQSEQWPQLEQALSTTQALRPEFL
jgi:prephenate dehydrogenase